MTIKSVVELQNRPIEINLLGPDGNAFVLLGTARRLGIHMGWEQEKLDSVLREMRSGDYEKLVATFEREFGPYVILYR